MCIDCGAKFLQCNSYYYKTTGKECQLKRNKKKM